MEKIKKLRKHDIPALIIMFVLAAAVLYALISWFFI